MIYTKCVYNDNLEFEWNENKNLANIDKHGIDFSQVKIIFYSLCVVGDSNNYAFKEQRWKCYGKFLGEIITIIFTKRKGKIRLISARKAHKKEREKYYEITKK